MSLLFNLDDYGAEVAAQDSQIGEMLNDSDSIREHMNSRRAIMYQQMRADEVKSKLCDKLRAEKLAVPGLKERVAALEVTDPELFAYIRKLEFVQDGIWCVKCNTMKKIGGKPKEESVEHFEQGLKESVNTAVHTPQIAAEELERLRREYETLQKNFTIVLDHLDTIRTEFQNKIKETSSVAAKLEKELLSMHSRTCELGLAVGANIPKVQFRQEGEDALGDEINRAFERHMRKEANQSAQNVNPNPPPSINSTVKKEDLPSVPTFNIDQLIEEKFASMSADDLLGGL